MGRYTTILFLIITSALFFGGLGCGTFDSIDEPSSSEKIAGSLKDFKHISISEWQGSNTQNSATTRNSNTTSLAVNNQEPVVIIMKDSPLLPSDRVKKGTQVQAVLVYRGAMNSDETLCREDCLQIFDNKSGKYVEVEKFEIDRTLPSCGTSENTRRFTVPANAPVGIYMLTSRIMTKSGQIMATRNYRFTIF